jgi:hypothetical protein
MTSLASPMNRKSRAATTTTNDSPSSQVSQTFRTAERGTLLRTISTKSQILAECQATFLTPLKSMASELTRQKAILHEALQYNKEEHALTLQDQEDMKLGMGVQLKTLKDQVTVLSAHKKVLVREVHTIRASLTESKSGMDLYRFALQGVEAALHNEASSDRLSRTQTHSVERAKQLGLMRLSRKRDELNRLGREVDQSQKKFRRIDQLVKKLEVKLNVIQGTDNDAQQQSQPQPPQSQPQTQGSSTNPGSSERQQHSSMSTPKTESWARRRISRVRQKFSPEKNKSNSGTISAAQQQEKDIKNGSPTDEELVHQICECLAEAMVLDEKMGQLVAVSSHDDDVLGPIHAASKVMEREGTRKNPDLEIVRGMCTECCLLLHMNAKQRKRNLSMSFGANRLSAKEHAKEMAERTSNGWKRLHPEVPIPSGLKIYLESAREMEIKQRKSRQPRSGNS